MGDANSSDLLSPLTYRPAMIRLPKRYETRHGKFQGLKGKHKIDKNYDLKGN
jgi:hypothetical protein